jgi:hypothetical protein
MVASSQQKQLNIRSDEAYETAQRLAKRLGVSTTEVVLRALQRLEGGTPVPDGALDARAQAFVDEILRRAKEVAARTPPGPGSDHRDFYDENGFPR